MMKTLLSGCIWLVLLAPAVASPQPPRTGTHLNAKGIPSQIEQFTAADRVEHIRALLQRGQREQALALAQQHVAQVEHQSLAHETEPRYFAYNSLCTVYISLKRSREAVAACNQAMALEPGRWSAVNNRATARLLAGDRAGALEDYRRARALAPEGVSGIRETLEHNIALAQQSEEAQQSKGERD